MVAFKFKHTKSTLRENNIYFSPKQTEFAYLNHDYKVFNTANIHAFFNKYFSSMLLIYPFILFLLINNYKILAMFTVLLETLKSF